MNGCAAPRHLDDPEPAAPHAWLCSLCIHDLRRDLHQMPGWWADIEELLQPSGSDGFGDGGKHSIGLPVRANAMEWRSQTRHDLEWWVLEVSARIGTQRPADTRVPVLAGWLCGHVRYAGRSIIYRPWAGDMAGTFTDLRRRARAITDPAPPTSSVIPAWGNICVRCRATGTLRVQRRTAVTCDGCGHEWDSSMLLRLGRDIIRTTERTAA